MINRNLPALLIVATLLGAMTPVIRAQSQPEAQRIKAAETMIFAGRCADAIALLRPIYDRYSRDERVVTALKNAYICSKDYDSALVVLQRQIGNTIGLSQKVNLQLDIAGIYFRQGNLDKGKKQIDAAIGLLPNEFAAYEHAADVFMTNGYYADAVKFLQESRVKINQPRQFARKLAQLYEVMRNYGDAARECFAMVQTDSTQDIYVSGRISSLIKLDSQEEYDTGLEKALADIVKANPRSKEAQRYYGEYLIAQGDYELALERFRIVDSLENGLGKNLLYFARVARDNGAFAMVDRACAQIAAIPKTPLLVQSRFILAESCFGHGDYARAASIYQDILNLGANDRDVSEAMYSLGVVSLQGLHDPRAAMTTFGQIMQRFPGIPLATAAKMLEGDCYLALGQDQVADSIYAMVNPKQLPQRSQEELLFKQAELKFFVGNFSEARDAYGKMMNAFPKSAYVNDCLRRIMLISEYSGMEEATLQIFASAMYSQFRFEYQHTLEELTKLKNRSGAILPELAWLKSGEIQQVLGHDVQALSEYDSLITLHPASFYTPIALERKGDVFADVQQNCEQARAMYQQVLLNHPNSLNVEEVRKKLQRTERLLCAGPQKTKS